jgi:DNA polymerase IV
VAISVSQLHNLWDVQLELPLGLEDEERRPGSKKRHGALDADRAIDMIRDRFGREAIGYGSVTLEGFRSVPDEFRELGEKDL